MAFQYAFSVYPAQCGKMSTWNSNKTYINLLNGEQFKWNRNFLSKPLISLKICELTTDEYNDSYYLTLVQPWVCISFSKSNV